MGVVNLQLPPRRLLEEESRASLESPKSLRISNHQNEAAPSSSRPASPPPSSANSSPLSPSQPDPRLPNPQTEHNVVASVSDQVAECSLNVILVLKILMVLVRYFSAEDSDGADCGHEREEAHRWNHRGSASRIRGAACGFGSVVESWFQKVWVEDGKEALA
ncbi:hypothetical protein LR48_Vigan02g021700 [Vigna angularis]|uniref:Uncharacterized protein n=1 Tax=Phaseolus angularis TaxID=3914 RepID=A0A0L9TUK9_PHAAN|nr:uncharacterized protein HKW66_Vig0187830 [Vigna angularis]KOM34067.1 hypothetical protein LR48_Vigan02g021700 [Vigna angularis]